MREKTSITKLKKTTPSQVRRWVKSATQKRIGPLGAEVAIDQVGLALSLRIGRCGAPGPPAALGALDSVSRHQPLHGAAGALDATAPQLLPGAP